MRLLFYIVVVSVALLGCGEEERSVYDYTIEELVAIQIKEHSERTRGGVPICTSPSATFRDCNLGNGEE